jgi:hypothetical protein
VEIILGHGFIEKLVIILHNGYHLAQWLSSNFAVQVSNWLDELFITGKVELGQEKSNKELENKFQEQIKLLTQEKQQAIEEKEQVIIEKETIARRFTSLTQNHNKMLKRDVKEEFTKSEYRT